MRTLGNSSLTVSPLCFGGNVFSWTIDEAESFAVLDDFVAHGGNFVDTADTYTSWVPGHTGGESEAIVGAWMRARKNRDDVVLATKVGQKPDRRGMAPETVRVAIDEALARLGVETVDLLYAHVDDQTVPLVDTLAELSRAVENGKARYIGASNYTGPRFQEAVEIQKHEGFAPFIALQPHYNLLRRDLFEGELQATCVAEGIACVPHSSLASCVLTGKHQVDARANDIPRALYVNQYLDIPHAPQVLDAVREVATRNDATMSAVALAWLSAQSSVVSPIASARTPSQLRDLLPMADLRLNHADLAVLDNASR